MKYFKRIADLFMAIILTLAFSWLFLLIILLYIITFQFPVFFKQQRVGKDERIFTLIKFRTLKNAEYTLQQRRFFIGDILRFTSLDELPQLWNVIEGEMSLVGPRPLPTAYLPLYSEEQRLRHLVRPGITGWAQINGRHGITWQEKFRLDVYYVRHVSFWLDVRIIIMTILLLLSFRKDLSLEERPFTGPLS